MSFYLSLYRYICDSIIQSTLLLIYLPPDCPISQSLYLSATRLSYQSVSLSISTFSLTLHRSISNYLFLLSLYHLSFKLSSSLSFYLPLYLSFYLLLYGLLYLPFSLYLDSIRHVSSLILMALERNLTPSLSLPIISTESEKKSKI